MKNYEAFTTEDFLLDEEFQDWVLNPESSRGSFWNNWMKEHSEKLAEIEQARNIILELQTGIRSEKLSPEDFQSMWENIMERKDQPAKARPKVWKIVAQIAAVFIGLAVIGYGIYLFKNPDGAEMAVNEVTSAITLELQDGTVVTLDENTSGVISMEGSREIARQNQQELVYERSATATDPIGEDLVYNTLAVPYGKKFELTLSDGTHIYLNSGSSLRYPVRFLNQAPRDVYLDGEAYFTVTSDESHPFTVHTHELNTRATGTEFNVSSYENDHNTFTVLVEGSVQVYDKINEGEGLFTPVEPGQRALFEDGKITVEAANVDKYTAWITGKLLFTDDRFDLILKKLERHFDVKIENRFLELNNKRFTGTFRNETLDQILTVFNAHTPFEYTTNGDRIIINKKVPDEK